MRKLLLFGALVSLVAVGCSKVVEDKTAASKSLILQVNQGQYDMTMYPRYETESQSKLYLDLKKDGKGIAGAQISAHLIARDGDKGTAEFVQDEHLKKYVAHVFLKHQEDYVIETEVRLNDKDQTVLRPTFAFHCGDPIPHVTDEDEHVEGPGKKSK